MVKYKWPIHYGPKGTEDNFIINYTVGNII